jgi:hypothetical protein
MPDTRLTMTDNVRIQVWDVAADGTHRLARTWTTHNLVTNAGKTLTANRMAGLAGAGVGWFAFGTSSNPTVVTDTLLGAEVFRDVITASALASPGVMSYTYYLSVNSANGNTLAEIGLFNVATANTATLFARANLSPAIVKTALVAITFTWTVSYQ